MGESNLSLRRYHSSITILDLICSPRLNCNSYQATVYLRLSHLTAGVMVDNRSKGPYFRSKCGYCVRFGSFSQSEQHAFADEILSTASHQNMKWHTSCKRKVSLSSMSRRSTVVLERSTHVVE